MERFRLSRFDDLSVDDFGEDLLLSYDDLRGDFELSFGDVLNDLLLPLIFPEHREREIVFVCCILVFVGPVSYSIYVCWLNCCEHLRGDLLSSFRSFELLLLDRARPLPDRDESRELFELLPFDDDFDFELLPLLDGDLVLVFDEFLYDVEELVRCFASLLVTFECKSTELLAIITDLSLNSLCG